MTPLKILYTNHRGKTALRTIMPSVIKWGSTEWHPEEQWLLTAYDHDKNAWRDFALNGFASLSSAPQVTDDAVEAALIKWCGGHREIHNPVMRANMRRVLEQFAASAPEKRGREFWMTYDDQGRGDWCITEEPPKVTRSNAEVIHVREVAASAPSRLDHDGILLWEIDGKEYAASFVREAIASHIQPASAPSAVEEAVRAERLLEQMNVWLTPITDSLDDDEEREQYAAFCLDLQNFIRARKP